MNLPLVATDNITELLVKIIEFTQARQKILTRNINHIDEPGFVPHDLAVGEFSELLNNAINEHTKNQRLLLRDTDNVKFGHAGTFQAKPIVDEIAERLLEENRDEYIELQINKLLENSLNQQVAAELLKEKHGITPGLGRP